MIVAPTNREAELLDRCLSGKVRDFIIPAHREVDLKGVGSLANSVDAIYITITGENKACEDVAKKYGAIVSHISWEHDFAKARNFNFSQVPVEYDYIYWADTDDVIRNPQLLRSITEKCKEEGMDAVVMNYLYDFDEDGNCNVKHMKTRILKNDGCVKWAGEVHEDFAPTRKIASYLNKEVEHIHLTDPKRIDDSAVRNRIIAEKAVEKHPEDPRVYWNLGNTYYLVGKKEEAVKIFLQFLEISNSDEERFLTWFRLASLYSDLNRSDYAIEAALEALALRPWYPDGYFLLGEINYNIGKYRNAREFLEMGLTKDVPETESIVWNPMDYTYNPHLVLAQTYFAMNMPRDAIKHFEVCLNIKPKSKSIKKMIDMLKKEIDKFDIAERIYKKSLGMKNIEDIKKLLDSVPKDMKYYPSIVSLRNRHFTKETSSGKDLAIYCGYTSIEWNPIVAQETGVGGSEEAIIQLSKRFAKAGYNVTVYLSTPGSQEYEIDGVKWVPYMAWNYKDKNDVVIIWRHPKMLDFNINAEKIYVDMHDVLPPEEFTTSRLLKATKIMFKSKVQRDYYPNIPDEKCEIIPHGLDIKEFESQRESINKNPYLILNTSSPDRGIKTAMRIIKSVYDRLPDNLKPLLKFSQYYGFDVWDTEFENDTQMVAWKKEAIDMMNELKKLGIMTEDSGKRISQKEVTKKYLESGVIFYPSEFFEIGYIGGIKGMLGGAIPFTTKAFAQGEFAKDGVLVDSDVTYKDWSRNIRDGSDYGVKDKKQIKEFIDKLVDYIKNPNKYDDMRNRLIEYAKNTFNWDATAESWLNTFK